MISTLRTGPESSPRSPNLLITRGRSPRRAMRLALAVALAVPVVASPLIAEEPTATPSAPVIDAVLPVNNGSPVLSLSMQPMSNPELLSKGADELNNKQYEEALATLQQVQADPNWDEATKGTFAQMMKKAEEGASERRAARAAFEKGETALAAGNSVEAISQYRVAAENRFADEGTRAKAREQISVAESLARKSTTDNKSVYQAAKSDFRAGRYADAKSKFEQLKAANYRPGLFEKSVSDYLKDTNEKLNAGFTGESVAVAPAPTPAPVDSNAAQAQAEARTAAEAKAAEKYEAAQARSTAEATKKQARDAYRMGRDQYRRGEWAASRENLTLARNLGYKPGLFEESPDKLLARMDAKESKDAALAAADAQRRADQEAAEKAAREAEAAAAAAAATPPVATATPPAEMPSTGIPSTTTPPPTTTTPPDASSAPAVATTTPPAEATTPPVTTPPPAEAPSVASSTPPAEATGTPAAADELRKTADALRVEREQNAFRAKEMVTQAATAADAGRLDEALTLYTSAAQLDPSNADAEAGRVRMAQLTAREPAARDILAEQEKRIRARREAITYSFDNSITRANTAITGNDFAAAQAAVNEARIARNQDPTIFQTDEINRFDTTLAGTQERLAQAQLAFDEAAMKESTARAAEQESLKLENERKQRIATIRSLKRTARELTEQRKYEEAVGVVDQILALDARDEYASGLRPVLEDQRQFAKQRKYREMFDRQLAEVLVDSEEKRIPYNEILRYPENWPELSEVRQRSVEAERGASEEDQVVAGALERKLPPINLNNVAFADVVDFLRDVSQTNIFVNWRALEAAGIARDTQVSARLQDVKFAKVLEVILNEVGGGTVRLNYTIDEGVISISTEEDLSQNVVTRVYDVRDLIINIPDFTEAPEFNLQSASQATAGAGGGSSNLFGGGGGGADDEGPTRQELVDEIIQLIQDTIASDSWKDNGGSVGSVRELQGQLIVTQTPENQRQLVRLLEQLRETRAIQVTIEARFLSVQRNFLEDVGVDIDFAFANLDQDRIFDPTNVTPANPGGTPGVIRVLQNSFGFTRAGTLDTNLPGNLANSINDQTGGIGAGLSTGITFLDDFQVTALLRATQAAQNVSTMNAPRVTLFNGQRAYVVVATQRAYVSDLTPIVGTNAVGFDPTPAFVSTGVKLDVQATVSSDRKYVTLTLRPDVATLLNLQNFQVAQATAGGAQAGGGQGGGQAGVATGFVQQPELQITQVRTTVSVPDGGTLLLGGQTLAAEIEREAGVPVLSKIPFLKRLFTNRSMAKDDQVLLILVKPTIIIQREQEQKQFPMLSDKAQ